jgi:hypothetical protein
VLTLSDSRGALYAPDGFTAEQLDEVGGGVRWWGWGFD